MASHEEVKFTEPDRKSLVKEHENSKMSKWKKETSGGLKVRWTWRGESDPPASRTLPSLFPSIYLPTPLLVRIAAFPCK